MRSLKSILNQRFCLSFLATIGLFWHLRDLLSMRNYASPIELSASFSFVLFFAFYYFYEKIDLKSKRLLCFTAGSALILSATYVVGSQLDITHTINWSGNTLLKIMMLGVACMPLTNYILRTSFKTQINQRLKTKNLMLIIIIAQLVFWVLSFPGVYGYDAGYQLLQLSDAAVPITQTYSVVHSVWMHLTITKIGIGMLGSSELGLAIYVISQIFITAIVVYVILKMATRYLPNIIIKLMALFLILPFSLIMYISTSQDTIFSVFAFLVFFLLLLWSLNPKLFDQKENQWLLGTAALVMCLFRNNGVYIIVFLLILMLALKNMRNRKVIYSLSASITIYIFFQIFLSGYAITDPSSDRNKMSVPSQQLARCVVTNANQLSDELINKYYYYYPNINLNIYKLNQQIADYQKDRFSSDHFQENKLAFLEYYTRMFLKCPKSYTEAFLFNTIGYWYLDKKYPDSQMYHPLIEYQYRNLKKLGANDKYLDIKRQSILPDIEKDIAQNITKATWQENPFLGILYRVSIPFTLFWMAWIKIVYRKKYQFLLPMLFLTGYYGTYFLAMVVLFRYQFAAWLSVPLLIFIIFYDTKIRKKG